MKIAFTGSHGFIASSIRKQWQSDGFDFISLDRNNSDSEWTRKLKAADVVINLAGAPVLQRWNWKNKEVIRNSRVITTRRLVNLLNQLTSEESPQLLISGSAIGIYKNDGTQICSEHCYSYGNDFLADVVKEWEQEAFSLVNPSVRLVVARIGVVLSYDGALLKKLLPLFQLNLGGTIGSGKQILSFIHIADLIASFRFFIETKISTGVYNLVSPNPVSNKYFTKSFANALHRKALFTVPSFTLKLVYGQAATIMTKGVHVIPERLLKEHFQFKYPTIEKALLRLG